MKHVDYVVAIMFREVSPHDILCERICYDEIQYQEYKTLVFSQMPYLSESETEELYWYLNYMSNHNNAGKGINVFELLKDITDKWLLIRDNQPLCSYSHLLAWRAFVRNVGEDLPVCAFLAARTEKTGYRWNDFEWGTVVQHDNSQLKRIMQKGISDNHFHLFGSAPSFQLIWLNLMNVLDDNNYIKGFQEIEKSKRSIHSQYKTDYKEESLEIMHLQAALIRIVLFYYSYYLNRIEYEGDAKEKLRELEREIPKIKALLIDSFYLKLFREKIQTEINALKIIALEHDSKDFMDYAVIGYERRSIYHDFEGERSLLYQMLLKRGKNEQIPAILMNWFYAYLVIKNRFYEELVQVNVNVGFENFTVYNKRKNNFLYTKMDTKRMIQHAVKSSFELKNMKSLELRISPGKSVKENTDFISMCDEYIDRILPDTDIKKCIYYVFHFPKQQDKILEWKNGYVYTCRHYQYRQKLQEKAYTLINFREKSPQAARVLGIDACSQEIRCRPEVFGPVFRQLTDHVVDLPNFCGVKQWKITYHVGEDWLEPVDALRAVDEAILFLNMKNGDRMGHATILGIDIRKWYESKKKVLHISLEEYWDNVVWLYHKILEFNIAGCETLKGFLRNEYEKYFSQLYSSYISENDIKEIRKKAQKGSVDIKDYWSFDINTFYEAWKLRGDDPILFQDGFFNNSYGILQEHYVNKNLSEGETIRRRFETGILVFYYHYSTDIRNDGMQRIAVEVPDIYIDGVFKVQLAMQKRVAEKGIAIETNPSSNYLISSIADYSEHPISRLYNVGLTLEHEEIKSCAQLNVSINTDDKGLFFTSLENEFALIGRAMESVKDSEGEQKYTQQMIYEWLDHIREKGNQQSFLERVE